ncbi:MAG: hypothetical protein KAW46_12560 [candidate division Zixibacteria bacterium]|nr:hypothetical protein [candidate division Zixibacteria bacterium]
MYSKTNFCVYEIQTWRNFYAQSQESNQEKGCAEEKGSQEKGRSEEEGGQENPLRSQDQGGQEVQALHEWEGEVLFFAQEGIGC